MKDEQGFTLVELIISMAIMAVIVGAVGAAAIMLLRNTDITQQKLAESHDAQISTAYFANDVQSAMKVSGSFPTPTNICGSPYATFTFPSGTTSQYTVVNRELIRTSAGTAATVSHNLYGTCISGNPDPAVTFTTAPGCSGTCTVYTMVVKDKSGYTYSLSGQTRAS